MAHVRRGIVRTSDFAQHRHGIRTRGVGQGANGSIARARGSEQCIPRRTKLGQRVTHYAAQCMSNSISQQGRHAQAKQAA